MLNVNSNPKIRMTTAISTSVNPDVRDRLMAKCPQRDSSAHATRAAPAWRVACELAIGHAGLRLEGFGWDGAQPLRPTTRACERRSAQCVASRDEGERDRATAA